MIQEIKNTIIYNTIRNLYTKWKHREEYKKWKKDKKKYTVPHLRKQEVIKKYQMKYDMKIFVETGTYIGDMMEAMKKDFDTLYSIELSENLYNRAKKRFRFNKKIHLVNGDSSEKLKDIISKLDQSAIFWLDGHFSEGITAKGNEYTPIMSEITTILKSEDRNHVILIDDARLFHTDQNYPEIEEVITLVKSFRPKIEIKVEDDIIIINNI